MLGVRSLCRLMKGASAGGMRVARTLENMSIGGCSQPTGGIVPRSVLPAGGLFDALFSRHAPQVQPCRRLTGRFARTLVGALMCAALEGCRGAVSGTWCATLPQRWVGGHTERGRGGVRWRGVEVTRRFLRGCAWLGARGAAPITVLMCNPEGRLAGCASQLDIRRGYRGRTWSVG